MFVQLRSALEIFFLLKDNAPAHKAARFLPIFGPQKSCNYLLPPYSTDLSSPDYFLFSKSKIKLKGLHSADVAEIQDKWWIKEGPKRRIFGRFS